MTIDQIIARLERQSNAQSVEGMARFGIRPARALGIAIPTLRKLAKEIGRNQALALAPWDSGIHEARFLAYQKATQWCQQEKEFIRRASFSMMAALAVHDKKAQDEAFLQFFPLIKQYAGDERNFVKKAVNWALRQIGKRNSNLHALALDCAYEILDSDSKTARWVAKDALKELQAKEFKN